MNENLKATIMQKLENLTDETGRQLLDYMEFIESKFNRSTRERTTLERLAENVEGTLRSSKIGEAAVKGTGGLIDAAGSVARSVAAAGQAVFDEFEKAMSGDSSEESERKEEGGEEGEGGGEREEGVEGGEGGEETKEKQPAGEADTPDETVESDETEGDEKSA